ncbi:MAG: EamA family transporter, partial [Cohaesibacter sp.]|nr:EamA family transporter [Cohaesibacter sp.]
VSGFIGILLGDLCLIRCLELGGPRRMQILFALNAPLAAMLGFAFLGEILPPTDAFGALLMLIGVLMAIFFVQGDSQENAYEHVEGKLTIIVLWGLSAALCQAIGLVAVKPAIDSGADPLAVSAYRTIGGAVIIISLALLPNLRFKHLGGKSMKVITQAILAGWMGYVLAMSLLLLALRSYNSGIVAVMGSTVPVMLLPIMWIKTGKCPPAPAWIGAALVVLGSVIIIL